MSGNRNGRSLSLVAQFDDIVRCYGILSEGCEQEFKRFVLGQEGVRLKWLEAVNECQRMKGSLDSANTEISKLNQKLRTARTMLDRERAMRKTAEQDLAAIIRDYAAMDHSVTNASLRNRISSDAKLLDRLNTISEHRDSDVRSELSYSRSDDDLDVSYPDKGRQWRKSRPSTLYSEPVSAKRRRSSLTTNSKRTVEVDVDNERLIATTTVTMKKGGPVVASQRMETVPTTSTNSSTFAQPAPPVPRKFLSTPKIVASAPPESDEETESVDMKLWNNENMQNISPNLGTYGYQINSRMHQFVSKTVIKPESCGPCGKRITFGKMALKCMDCRAVAHYDCKDKVPLPCVAMGGTPTAKGAQKGTIADYTPLVPPMVPALVIHCINEIEERGFSELGLYRVPGSDKDVKALKEKFMRGKGAPNLSLVKDIHVVCGCLKNFLINLSEPLILQSMWNDFVRATEVERNKDLDESRAILYQAIASLPQPNRDTLAYIILHLQRVAEVPECKMPASSLADVFGPTLVGPRTLTTDAAQACKEVHQSSAVVRLLLSVPSDYWATFVSGSGTVPSVTPSTCSLRNTPSTENLMRQTVNRLFSTPLRQRTLRRKRFFDTPPSCKRQ